MARPSGAKVWIYRFRDPAGKMAQLLIGSFPALSLADARSEWRNHRANRDKHGDPCDEVRRRQEAAKVAAIVPMRKRAPRVAAMGISALRGVIRHARSMNRLDLDVIDPTAGIPTIPQGKRSRALSDPEISLLLRWLDSGAVSRTIVDVLRLTLYTGARSGEVCAAPPAPAWRAWAARSRSANPSLATGCRVWPASITSRPTPTRCASGWTGGRSMWRA